MGASIYITDTRHTGWLRIVGNASASLKALYVFTDDEKCPSAIFKFKRFHPTNLNMNDLLVLVF